MSKIIVKNVREVMGTSYINYAMSVIIGRALPDIRDGMKPVHRRILYSMNELGNTANKPYKKSARIVGDVIGKFHPHGDSAVYDSMVRMAQPFSMTQPLVDGQGNFGSIDGDSPAAMRYTEVRMSKLSMEFFKDIGMETVNFVPNYDGSESEPEVLPVPYPNILVTGVEGIAVGMATKIPPHNFNEVLDVTLGLIENPEMSTAEFLVKMPAPDFPTHGVVYGQDAVASAVEEGKGAFRIRAKYHVEERKQGSRLVITELPYQVNKASLIESIAELVKLRKIEGITGLKDTSAKNGIRIEVEVRRDTDPEVLFSQLAAMVSLDISYSYNCVVIRDGRPELLGLKEIVLEWIKFRKGVVLKRFEYLHRKAQAKMHIMEGLIKAMGMLDATIRTIRDSTSGSEAKDGLMQLLTIDEIQAQAILDMRLQKLTGMELAGIQKDYEELANYIQGLKETIESPLKIQQVIVDELQDLRSRYSHERRTEINHSLSTFAREDLIEREDVLVVLSQSDYIKRIPVDAISTQNRGTRGKRALKTHDDDSVKSMYQVNTHDMVLVFGKSGQAYGTKAYNIPEAGLNTAGRHIKNVIEGFEEEIHSMVAIPEADEKLRVVTVTRKGQVKKTRLEAYQNATRKGGVQGVGIADGDALMDAFVCSDNDHLILVSSSGRAVRFRMADVSTVGRTANGVRGMRIPEGERLVGAYVIREGDDDGQYLFCIGEKGIGKRTKLSEFGVKGRGGKGMAAFKMTERTGELVKAIGVRMEQDLVMFASNGVSNKIRVEDISESGRATSGVKLMNLDKGSVVTTVVTAKKIEDVEALDSVEE